MRNKRVKLNVKEVEVLVYNSVTKKEETIKATLSEVEKSVTLPEGCVEISQTVIEEKEVTFVMTPQEFVKHATIEE